MKDPSRILPRGCFPATSWTVHSLRQKIKKIHTYLWILLDTFEKLIGSIHSGLWGDSCDIGYRLHQAKITSHCIREARHHTELWNYKILFRMSRDSNGIILLVHIIQLLSWVRVAWARPIINFRAKNEIMFPRFLLAETQLKLVMKVRTISRQL